MISIAESLAVLEKAHQERDAAVESYVRALKAVSHYTIELEPDLTVSQRKYLDSLAEEAEAGTVPVLAESQRTLRGLLRDYRDKASAYLKRLRDELDGICRAMEQVLSSLAMTDGEHENHLRSALGRLREVVRSPASAQFRGVLSGAVETIEASLEEMRKEHQLTVSQLRVEMSVLHKRIDTLEAAAAVDQLTELFNRREMEERIREGQSSGSVLLAKVSGFRKAELYFRKEVAAELIAAFTKRLRNSLPPESIVGRWAHEEFVALLTTGVNQTGLLAKSLSEQLSGPYACLMGGKTVNPKLQVSVAVVDSDGASPDRVLQRISGFLAG